MTQRVNGSQVGSLAPSLPAAAYLDPDVFRAEQAAVFAPSWLCVARCDAVADAGDVVTVEVSGESVLLVRGRDGRLRAFRNLCRHRGARLCLAGSANVGPAIGCPYHGWTYALDGVLIGAPNMPEMPDLVKADYGLHPVRLTEWLGYAWVTLDPDAGELAEQVDPQLVERFGTVETLKRYGVQALAPVHTITYRVASNWKAVIENFMECYHCGTLHPELTAALPQFATGWGTVSGGVGSGAALARGLGGFSLSGKATGARLPGLLDEDDRLFFGVILRPSVFLILVPDHVAVFRLIPQDAGHTTVVVDWLFDPAAAVEPGFDPSDAIELLDRTNRQDWDACERCQLGMTSSAYAAVLVPAEHVILEFHDWVRGRLAGRLAGRS